jgi:uncharacterized protein (TIGR02145 family)
MKTFIYILCFFTTIVFAQSKINNSITVKISEKEWQNKNLTVTVFNNGNSISFAKSKEEWIEFCNKKTPAFCYFNFESSDNKHYGCFYNWYAINDNRGLAPEGYSIPNGEDVGLLLSKLSINGSEIKSTIGWGGDGNNKTGLNIIATGWLTKDGTWSWENRGASFWTRNGSLENSRALGWHVYEDQVGCGEWSDINSTGYSVRCIKN